MTRQDVMLIAGLLTILTNIVALYTLSATYRTLNLGVTPIDERPY